MMNPEAREELDRILAQDKGDLTDSDKEFIRARRSYLSEEQKAIYKDVLSEVEETVEEPVESSEEDSKDKAPKKLKK